MRERLEPIPTPPAHWWRQVRLQYLPVLVFVLGIGVAILLWTRWVAPPTLVGEAEAVRTELRSFHAGRIVELRTDLLQPVQAGDVIGQVIVNEPHVLETSLAVIRAEMEVLRQTTNLAIEQQQLDLLNKRVQLVALKGQLQLADATLSRTTALHRARLITEEEFDQARNTRDSVQAQLEAQAELVRRAELGLRATDAGEPAVPTHTQTLRATLAQKSEQLKLLEAQLGPRPLIAPIDGIVTQVYRRTGEAVATAEPIVQITAPRFERIVGFLRQPLPLEPKPGMAVEVRTRTFVRRSALSTVAQVGRQLEPLTPTLLAAMRLPVSTLPSEYGIRVHIVPPAGLELRPGEHVDLILRD
jgi:multidrug resistance efflux pump